MYCARWRRCPQGLCRPNTFSLPVISRAMQKKYATGRPDQKDLNENLAATQGLAHMITECNHLFEVRRSLNEMMQFQAWVHYQLASKCSGLL